MAGSVETRERNQRHLTKKKVKPSTRQAKHCLPIYGPWLKGKHFEAENCAFKNPFPASPGHYIVLVWKAIKKIFTRYKEKCTNLGLLSKGYIIERGDQLACSEGGFQLKASHSSEAIYSPTEGRGLDWQMAPEQPAPAVWLPAQLPPPSGGRSSPSFRPLLTISSHTGGISLGCLFQEL